jgi:hypothetical protein
MDPQLESGEGFISPRTAPLSRDALLIGGRASGDRLPGTVGEHEIGDELRRETWGIVYKRARYPPRL